MTDRPIIFSSAMLRALLAGRKTQTRRLATSPLRRCAPGDRLYVRERGWLSPSKSVFTPFVGNELTTSVSGDLALKSCPSIHMPRWASRLTLTVEDVRVEPLQAISRADAIAEGIQRLGGGMLRWENWSGADGQCATSPEAAFAVLWQSLHTKQGERWEDDPSVVALTFRVVAGNIDRIEA